MAVVTRRASDTVDLVEVDRYNRLAKLWWQSDGPMWPLHRLNDVRVPFIEAEIGSSLGSRGGDAALAGLKVLDVGCGAGLLAEAMARRGAQVIAIDPAENNIEIARAHAAAGGLDIDYRVGSLETVGEDDFDVVLNMEVVEHVELLNEFLERASRRVVLGGLHFVATINRTLPAFISAIVGAEYVLRWLPKGTHQWRKFVKPAELAALLADVGFEIVSRRGVAVNPFTRAYRMTAYLGINYMLVARRGQ
tara:strand:+ start:5449 stop:6195 length:747 start_codon:yes stop_codon:yes gene_type:complete